MSPRPFILAAASLALLLPAGCNKGRKDSTEKNIAKAEQSKPGKKPAPLPAGEPALPPVEKKSPEAGPAEDESGLPPDTQAGPPGLPDLSGFSGIDPDSFPEGEEGLDAIVQLWTDIGDDAKKKADMQDEILAGRTLRTTKELSKCLPDKVAGWKTAGSGSSRPRRSSSSSPPAPLH